MGCEQKRSVLLSCQAKNVLLWLFSSLLPCCRGSGNRDGGIIRWKLPRERFSAESSALDFWARNEPLPCPATHIFGFSSFPHHTVSLPIRYFSNIFFKCIYIFSNVFTIRIIIQIFIRIPNVALETILDVKIPHSYLLIPVIKMCIWKSVGCSVWQLFAKYSCGFWNAWTVPKLWELRRRKCRSSLPSELCILCIIQGRRNIYEYCAGEASFKITACKKVIISVVQIGLWKWALEEILSWWSIPAVAPFSMSCSCPPL